MTSLHATIRDALAPLPLFDQAPERVEAAVAAWLASDEATTHAAQAIHSLPSPTAEGYDDWCRAAARAALGAFTHHEADT